MRCLVMVKSEQHMTDMEKMGFKGDGIGQEEDTLKRALQEEVISIHLIHSTCSEHSLVTVTPLVILLEIHLQECFLNTHIPITQEDSFIPTNAFLVQTYM